MGMIAVILASVTAMTGISLFLVAAGEVGAGRIRREAAGLEPFQGLSADLAGIREAARRRAVTQVRAEAWQWTATEDRDEEAVAAAIARGVAEEARIAGEVVVRKDAPAPVRKSPVRAD